MAKYSKTQTRRVPTAPIRTTTGVSTLTYNGDRGYVRDAKSELFVLAVNFMGEQEVTYYESGDDRQTRFVDLIHQVTLEDSKWMQHFVPFLRNDAYMRTASIIAAAEYAHAGGPEAASVIASAIKRADEPSELLGYWLAKYGRQLPMAVKRGLASAARRVYTEYNVLKYDTKSHAVRFGDVLNLAHPRALTPEQNDLFGLILDRRHHPDAVRVSDKLPMIRKNAELRDVQRDQRREYLRTIKDERVLADAGFTWETLSEWLPGGMDAEAWEWMIPSMGYMALLRNLRNFDQAGVCDAVADTVIARLSDPEQVAKSMQFPYRFYSAFKNTGTTRWARALDQALDLSTSNVPHLKGRTLVLIDLSGSMGQTLSNKSTMQNWEAAAVFGVAQFRAARFEGDIVGFADYGQHVPMGKGTSILKGVEQVRNVFEHGSIGYGTEMWPAVEQFYAGHDRVLLFTDMQANMFHGHERVLGRINGPVYFWNLGGYKPSAAQTGINGVYEMAGLSDATFRQIALLEAAKDANWPWG